MLFKHDKKIKIKGYRKEISQMSARLAETDWCWHYGWKKADYACHKELNCNTQFGCFECLLKNAKVKIFD